jgi:hypothetical protein
MLVRDSTTIYEMRGILVDRTRVQGFIPYSTLVSQVRAVRLKPDSYALAHMLGEISTEEDAAGRGVLTASDATSANGS